MRQDKRDVYLKLTKTQGVMNTLIRSMQQDPRNKMEEFGISPTEDQEREMNNRHNALMMDVLMEALGLIRFLETENTIPSVLNQAALDMISEDT